MPLESGGHRGMLSEERTYLQDDSHNNVLKTDTKQVQLDTNQPQTDTNQPQAAIQNHDLILGAERIQEDINLEPVQCRPARRTTVKSTGMSTRTRNSLTMNSAINTQNGRFRPAVMKLLHNRFRKQGSMGM